MSALAPTSIAARRLVEDHHLGPRASQRREQHLLLVAAGERRDRVVLRAPQPQRCAAPAPRTPSRGGRRAAAAADPVEGAEADVVADGQRHEEPLRPALLRDEPDARRTARRSAPAADRPAVELDRAGSRLAWPNTAWASSLRPEPISPATPSTSPACSVEADAVELAARPRIAARARRGSSPASSCASSRLDLAADHLPHELGLVEGADRPVRHAAAVPHHGDPVGDLHDLPQAVRDVQITDALLLEPGRRSRAAAAPPIRRGPPSARP